MQLSEASLYLQDNKQDIICSLHLQNLKHESDAVQLQIQHLKILSKGHKRFCAGTGGGGGVGGGICLTVREMQAETRKGKREGD